MINLAESGAGKTSALASLLDAGFQVRVLDLDNGMESLINLLTDPASPYRKDAISRLRWRTLTEPMRVLGGKIYPKQASVWPNAVGMLPAWKGDYRWDSERGEKVPTAPAEALGDISTWGEDCILVLDTLSSLGTAARNFHLQLQGKLVADRSSMDGMRDVGSAQNYLEQFLQIIFAENVKCHVVVNTHIVYTKEDGRSAEPGYDGALFAHPAAIGKAFSVKGIAKYFNHMLMTRDAAGQKKIHTKGVMNVGLKSGAPLRVKQSYGLKFGLAEYFRDVLGKTPLPSSGGSGQGASPAPSANPLAALSEK